MAGKILLVDDEWRQLKLKEELELRLQNQVEVLGEERAEKAVRLLKDHSDIRLVFLDLCFPGQSKQGPDIFREIRDQFPELPVIILSSIESARQIAPLMLAGAYYYIYKLDLDYEQLAQTVRNAIGYYELKTDALRRTDIGYIVGESPAIKDVLRLIEKASQTDSPVLVTGDTGTGKELAVRSIHINSRRKNKPLVVVNCAALPENLVESELFGHLKGAFTGADREREGRFEKADGGTILLDEIGELKPEIQAKLLRVVQFGEIEKVGSSKPSKIDVRVIAATNRDLAAGLKQGTFREDLYYRLRVIPIHLPPLRDRKEDIPILAKHIVTRLNSNMRTSKDIDDEGIKFLQAYNWPGNVRELENVLERAMTLSASDVLSKKEFDAFIHPVSGAEPAAVNVWVEKVYEGRGNWDDIKREFAASGNTRRNILEGLIRRLRDDKGKRPSGDELAKCLGVNRNHLNQILNSVGLQLKDFA